MDKDELVQIITRIVKETVSNDNKLFVSVGISVKHVHLSRAHMDILFGKGSVLTEKKDLMGGQFAAEECVTILGAKLSSMEKVRILGPLRRESQVEISKTDSIVMGIKAPLRQSGLIEKSAPITLVGPNGSVTLIEGCIIAKRHVHMTPQEGKKFGFLNNQLVNLKIPGERGGILGNVQVRIDPTYSLEMHIDTDEANAMGIKNGSLLEIVK
ncbi:phosphate propanoyltransferase [Clostridium lacusfryxellense]|uniref:phosphate propanoyltransferase n=1 Tax=Clostridium lacusfryxellense TaxID=205328 RepID=UPI001C0B44A5|nr:phosphate propanoyltransferase [Clostridium lacusfryxellense]MBU3112755.1 phosphate propanoyltransferase [Clostridium lacusfryxellense]